MALVELAGRNRGVAMVDDSDVAALSVCRWGASRALNGNLYAVGTPQKNGRRIGMAAFLLKPAAGLEVDHINGDTLDNRRHNLRVCTHAQNMKNRKASRGATSKYKGVWWRPSTRKWCAEIVADGDRIYLAGC